jgi:hypothetical protein
MQQSRIVKQSYTNVARKSNLSKFKVFGLFKRVRSSDTFRRVTAEQADLDALKSVSSPFLMIRKDALGKKRIVKKYNIPIGISLHQNR